MLKKYKMPNGLIYQFEESKAPECAVPLEKAKKVKNKAKKAKTKKVAE